MAAFDDDGKYGEICWIDAWNTTGLCECFRTELLQLFTTLKTDGQTLVVVEPFRDHRRFIPLRPFSGEVLSFNVTTIPESYAQLFEDGIGKVSDGRPFVFIA